jgi:hypothetical protein
MHEVHTRGGGGYKPSNPDHARRKGRDLGVRSVESAEVVSDVVLGAVMYVSEDGQGHVLSWKQGWGMCMCASQEQ